MIKSWTIAVKKKVGNTVSLRNGSIFQIPNSPPYLSILKFNIARFCCQKPKTLRTILILEGGRFFLSKIDFLICLNSLVQDCSKNIFKNRNFSRSVLFHMKIRVWVKYFVNECLWKQFLSSDSPKTTSSLVCFTVFITLRSLVHF